MWNLSKIKKICSANVQFTLSDILVAMATRDDASFFHGNPHPGHVY